MQQQVRLFLEELRRFSASLVTIESKFLVIRKGFLQEIGVDFRGLDNPGAPFTDLDDVNLDLEPTLGLDNSGDGVTLTPPSAGAFLDEGGDGDIKGRTDFRPARERERPARQPEPLGPRPRQSLSPRC